jgi:polyhydroxyalkanoate synthesis regulator phasin
METSRTVNKGEFNLEEAKVEINRLLRVYRIKKDDLEWADDDWEVGEIQEELDGYARKIKVLKAKVREYEKSVKV